MKHMPKTASYDLEIADMKSKREQDEESTNHRSYRSGRKLSQ